MVLPSSCRIPRAPHYFIQLYYLYFQYGTFTLYSQPFQIVLAYSIISKLCLFRFRSPLLTEYSPYGVFFLSYRYLDVSVPCVRLYNQRYTCNKSYEFPHSEIHGSQIFTSPHGLSQCNTSFFASRCVGIPQMPFCAC